MFLERGWVGLHTCKSLNPSEQFANTFGPGGLRFQPLHDYTYGRGCINLLCLKDDVILEAMENDNKNGEVLQRYVWYDNQGKGSNSLLLLPHSLFKMNPGSMRFECLLFGGLCIEHLVHPGLERRISTRTAVQEP